MTGNKASRLWYQAVRAYPRTTKINNFTVHIGSNRGWLNHTDAVKRGIAMSTRLAEIKMEHDLNDLDFATMMEAIDDTLPIVLHNGGMPFSMSDLCILIFWGALCHP